METKGEYKTKANRKIKPSEKSEDSETLTRALIAYCKHWVKEQIERKSQGLSVGEIGPLKGQPMDAEAVAKALITYYINK